ncbi:MAG: thioredoxin family protein [Clostridiales Family XIII bacterium]|nr:thioredoxin family protein [Clostridiales Family XIII bacterium]
MKTEETTYHFSSNSKPVFRGVAAAVATLALGAILMALSANGIYREGEIISHTPSLKIPAYVSAINWVALIGSFAVIIAALVILAVLKRRRYLVYFLLAGLVAITALWIESDRSFSAYIEESGAIPAQESMDNPNFAEISLYTFREYFSLADDEIPVYIGRADCPRCTSFENEMTPFLEQNTFALTTYYTDSDRDGPRSKEMYDLLAKHGIDSVPSFIVIKNSKVIKSWQSPTDETESIKDYLSGWLRNH